MEELFVSKIIEWGRKNKRDFPWRKERTPYKSLISEILLQRTPATRVSMIFPNFILKFPSVESLDKSDVSQLNELLKPLGLKKRALWMKSLAKILISQYDGRVPDTEAELLQINGIGLYTARAILCFGFNQQVPIVDVNIARIFSRVFKGSEFTGKAACDQTMWTLASKLLPIEMSVEYNEALLDYSSIVCKKNPDCQNCILISLCKFFTS